VSSCIPFFSRSWNHGLYFFMACYDKHTCMKYIYRFYQQKVLIPFTNSIYTCLYITFVHDTSMYIHITYLNAHIQQGLNPRPLRDAPSSLTMKSLQYFKKFNLLCLAWNCLENSNFKICFLFQNILKYYKWKHGLEAYSILY